MLPIIKYPGGKKNEISLFKDWIPEKFNTYIEPFVGGGAVYFYLENKKNIINDINEDLINFYKKISTDSDNLIKELKLMKNNKDFYLEIRKMYNENDTSKFSKEAMFYYLNRTCYGGIVRYNSKKEFNTPFGKYSTYKPWEYISDEHVNLLKNTQFMSKSFEEAFKKAKKGDFVFIDPPYSSNFNNYYENNFSDEQHKKLAECIRTSPAKCLAVISDLGNIPIIYKDLIKESYDKKYGINIKDDTQVKHLIITNYSK